METVIKIVKLRKKVSLVCQSPLVLPNYFVSDIQEAQGLLLQRLMRKESAVQHVKNIGRGNDEIRFVLLFKSKRNLKILIKRLPGKLNLISTNRLTGK